MNPKNSENNPTEAFNMRMRKMKRTKKTMIILKMKNSLIDLDSSEKSKLLMFI